MLSRPRREGVTAEEVVAPLPAAAVELTAEERAVEARAAEARAELEGDCQAALLREAAAQARCKRLEAELEEVKVAHAERLAEIRTDLREEVFASRAQTRLSA